MALPSIHKSIGVDNASKIQMLANYERYDPGKTLIKLTLDGKFYFVVSSEGIDVYEVQSKQLVRHHDITLRLIYYRDGYYSNDLQIAQDNSRFMARVSDGKVAVYDLDGREIFVYEFPPELHGNGWASFSPDGKYLVLDICSGCNAYKGQGAFKVIDINTGNIVYEAGRTPGGEAHGWLPIFSPDGKILATEFQGQVVLWNTNDWKRLTDFSVNSGTIGDRIYFSPDSKIVAVMGDSQVYVWGLEDHRQIRGIDACGNGYELPQAIFSQDNSTIAILNCKKITIWKITDGTQISEQDNQFTSLTGLLLNNDGKLTLFLPTPKPGVTYAPWNSWTHYINSDFKFTGNPTSSSLNFVGSSDACSLSVKGQFNCAEGNFILGKDEEFYKVISNKKMVELRRGIDGKGESIISIKWIGLYFTPVGLDLDHKLFFYTVWSDSHSSSVNLMDTSSAKNISGWPKWIKDEKIVYSPDGNLAAFYLGLNPGTRFIVYDLANRKTVFQAYSSWNNWGGMAFSPDGKHLAYFLVQPGEKYDFFNLVEIGKWTNISRHEYAPIQGAWPFVTIYSPDGALLAIGFNNGFVRIYDTRNDTLVYEWKAHNGLISGLSFSPDMTYLASSSDNGTVRIWGIWP